MNVHLYIYTISYVFNFFLVLDKLVNGRVLFSTNDTATLQWNPPVNHHPVCNFIGQTVNCSYSNASQEVTTHKPFQAVVLNNFLVSTKYTCYSAKNDEITSLTKIGGNYIYTNYSQNMPITTTEFRTTNIFPSVTLHVESVKQIETLKLDRKKAYL